MFGRVDGLGLRSSCLCFWDPLALYVCPSWIHGQRTKEAILLNDDDTIIINTVTPRRQDTTKQPAVGAVKSDDDRWETRTCIAANNSLEVIWSFSPPRKVSTSRRLGDDFQTHNYALLVLVLPTNFGLCRIALTVKAIRCVGIPLRMN
jgi:hypothetical protein